MMTLEEHLKAAGSGATISNKASPRAHRLVTAAARAQCGELYEAYCTQIPNFRSKFPTEREFIKQFWGYFIESARTTLALSLSTKIPEHLKEKIHQALLMDLSLKPSRAHIPQIKLDI